MKRMLGIMILLCVLPLCSSYGGDQGWVCQMDRAKAVKRMNAEHEKRMAAWTKVYGLNPEQQNKISAIMIKYRDRELAEKDKLIDSLVTAINDSDAEIKAVMTPAQIYKYEETKKREHKDIGERMREWFESGMCY